MTLAPSTSSGDWPTLNAAERPQRPKTSLRAVSLVSSLTGVQLMIQFAIQIVMAWLFGAGREVDVFVAAVATPTVLSSMLSASLGYVLVPVIAEALRRDDRAAAASIATQIGCGLTALSMLVTVLVATFANPLVALLCPGFLPADLKLAASLLRVLSVLIVLNCLIAFLNALYHSFGLFGRPAVAGAVGTAVTLFYLLALHPLQGIFSIAWGVVAGSVVAVALMAPLLMAQFDRSSATALQLHPGTRRSLWLLAPLVLAALYWRLDPLLDRYLGSFLNAGTVAHMGYSWRLASGLMLIGTSGLSIVAFPAIAGHVAAGRKEALESELAHALRFFLFLMIPISVGICVFALPVVRLLFEHGRFTAADSQAVAWLIVLYAGVILGAGLGDLFSRTSYAYQDMRTPVMVSIVTFTIAAAVKVLVVRAWGVAGIVAATSFYSLLNAVVLAALLRAQLSAAIYDGTSKTTLRALGASAVACSAAAAFMLIPGRWAVLPAAAAGAVVYFAAMRVMGDEFARQLERWLRRRSAE